MFVQDCNRNIILLVIYVVINLCLLTSGGVEIDHAQDTTLKKIIKEAGRKKESLDKLNRQRQARHVPVEVLKYYVMLLDKIKEGNVVQLNDPQENPAKNFIRSVDKYLKETNHTHHDHEVNELESIIPTAQGITSHGTATTSFTRVTRETKSHKSNQHKKTSKHKSKSKKNKNHKNHEKSKSKSHKRKHRTHSNWHEIITNETSTIANNVQITQSSASVYPTQAAYTHQSVIPQKGHTKTKVTKPNDIFEDAYPTKSTTQKHVKKKKQTHKHKHITFKVKKKKQNHVVPSSRNVTSNTTQHTEKNNADTEEDGSGEELKQNLHLDKPDKYLNKPVKEHKINKNYTSLEKAGSKIESGSKRTLNATNVPNNRNASNEIRGSVSCVKCLTNKKSGNNGNKTTTPVNRNTTNAINHNANSTILGEGNLDNSTSTSENITTESTSVLTIQPVSPKQHVNTTEARNFSSSSNIHASTHENKSSSMNAPKTPITNSNSTSNIANVTIIDFNNKGQAVNTNSTSKPVAVQSLNSTRNITNHKPLNTTTNLTSAMTSTFNSRQNKTQNKTVALSTNINSINTNSSTKAVNNSTPLKNVTSNLKSCCNISDLCRNITCRHDVENMTSSNVLTTNQPINKTNENQNIERKITNKTSNAILHNTTAVPMNRTKVVTNNGWNSTTANTTMQRLNETGRNQNLTNSDLHLNSTNANHKTISQNSTIQNNTTPPTEAPKSFKISTKHGKSFTARVSSSVSINVKTGTNLISNPPKNLTDNENFTFDLGTERTQYVKKFVDNPGKDSLPNTKKIDYLTRNPQPTEPITVFSTKTKVNTAFGNKTGITRSISKNTTVEMKEVSKRTYSENATTSAPLTTAESISSKTNSLHSRFPTYFAVQNGDNETALAVDENSQPTDKTQNPGLNNENSFSNTPSPTTKQILLVTTRIQNIFGTKPITLPFETTTTTTTTTTSTTTTTTTTPTTTTTTTTKTPTTMSPPDAKLENFITEKEAISSTTTTEGILDQKKNVTIDNSQKTLITNNKQPHTDLLEIFTKDESKFITQHKIGVQRKHATETLSTHKPNLMTEEDENQVSQTKTTEMLPTHEPSLIMTEEHENQVAETGKKTQTTQMLPTHEPSLMTEERENSVSATGKKTKTTEMLPTQEPILQTKGHENQVAETGKKTKTTQVLPAQVTNLMTKESGNRVSTAEEKKETTQQLPTPKSNLLKNGHEKRVPEALEKNKTIPVSTSKQVNQGSQATKNKKVYFTSTHSTSSNHHIFQSSQLPLSNPHASSSSSHNEVTATLNVGNTHVPYSDTTTVEDGNNFKSTKFLGLPFINTRVPTQIPVIHSPFMSSSKKRLHSKKENAFSTRMPTQPTWTDIGDSRLTSIKTKTILPKTVNTTTEIKNTIKAENHTKTNELAHTTEKTDNTVEGNKHSIVKSSTTNEKNEPKTTWVTLTPQDPDTKSSSSSHRRQTQYSSKYKIKHVKTKPTTKQILFTTATITLKPSSKIESFTGKTSSKFFKSPSGKPWTTHLKKKQVLTSDLENFFNTVTTEPITLRKSLKTHYKKSTIIKPTKKTLTTPKTSNASLELLKAFENEEKKSSSSQPTLSIFHTKITSEGILSNSTVEDNAPKNLTILQQNNQAVQNTTLSTNAPQLNVTTIKTITKRHTSGYFVTHKTRTHNGRHTKIKTLHSSRRPLTSMSTMAKTNKPMKWLEFMNTSVTSQSNESYPLQRKIIQILTDNNRQDEKSKVEPEVLKFLQELIERIDNPTPSTEIKIIHPTVPEYKLNWKCRPDATSWSTAYIIGMSRFLQSHGIKCKYNEFLQEFVLRDNKDQFFPLFRYEYTCCQLSLQTLIIP